MHNSLRKLTLPAIVFLLVGAGLYVYFKPDITSSRLEKEEKVEKENELNRARMNKGRAEYFFRMLRDPATNSIPDNIREKELAYAKHLLEIQQSSSSMKFANPRVAASTGAFNWSQAGPYNVGGRTRALAIDQNNSFHILAAGVSGGIWESTNNGQSWSLRNNPNQNLSVSYVTQDPTNPTTWYYSSGEFVGNTASSQGGSAPYRGTGIYKSVDNGSSWTVLSSTAALADTSYYSPFQYVSKIAVSPTTGTIFVASYNFGILKSTDGGATWTHPLGVTNGHVYIGLAVNKNGDILASLSQLSYGGLSVQNQTGYKKPGLYLSTDDGATWTNVTPSGFPSTYERTVIAFAPSAPNVAYTLTYDGSTSNKQSKVSFFKLTFSGGNLSSANDRSANIPNYGGSVGQFNVQNNYNMVLSVKPDNANFVLIGGTNLIRSSDGFSTSPTKDYGWVGGYDTANNITTYPNQHPDQHIAVFDPKNPKHVWTGHDGGVSYTSDITATSTTGDPVVWTDENNGYLVSQFYTIAMNKSAGDNRLLGGAQDNGTPFFMASTNTSTTSTDVSSGDGGFAYLGSNYAYTETQKGDVSRHSYDLGGNITQYTPVTDITPSNASNQLFVTPYAVDPKNESIMYYTAGDSLWRNTKITSTTPKSSWQLLSQIHGPSQYVLSSVSVSHSPSHVVYIGASSQNVQSNQVVGSPIVFRINHADTATTALNRSSTKFPDGGYISDIAVNPVNADQILVIFSNYNIPSIFYSSDGGNTYTNVEGNLSGDSNGGTGPSVRSATILPTKNGTYYIVGTSTGLYMTTTLNGSSTTWNKEANTLIGDAVVERLDSRTTDGRVAVASHGRGVFIGDLSNSGSALPVKKPIQLPGKFKLDQNYPNPFNPSTNITYNLPVTSKVTLTIYDIMGRKVETLVSNETQGGGSHNLTFHADNLASGTYFYRITAVPQSSNASRFTQTKKMVLLK